MSLKEAGIITAVLIWKYSMLLQIIICSNKYYSCKLLGLQHTVNIQNLRCLQDHSPFTNSLFYGLKTWNYLLSKVHNLIPEYITAPKKLHSNSSHSMIYYFTSYKFPSSVNECFGLIIDAKPWQTFCFWFSPHAATACPRRLHNIVFTWSPLGLFLWCHQNCAVRSNSTYCDECQDYAGWSSITDTDTDTQDAISARSAKLE